MKRKCCICKKKSEAGTITFGTRTVCNSCFDKITDFVIKEDIKLLRALAKK